MSIQYFTILGISSKSNADEMKAKWRELVLVYHPDKPGGNADKFKQIQNAYEQLNLYYEGLRGKPSEQKEAEGDDATMTGFRQCPTCDKVFLPLFSDFCSATCKGCSSTNENTEVETSLEESSFIRTVLRTFRFLFTDQPIRLTRAKGRGTAVFHDLIGCPAAIGITTREKDPRNPTRDKSFFYMLHSIQGKYQIKQVEGIDGKSLAFSVGIDSFQDRVGANHGSVTELIMAFTSIKRVKFLRQLDLS